MINPSELTLRFTGIAPRGQPAVKPGRCTMCGSSFHEGDIVDKFVPGKSFTDYSSLRASESKIICGWCATLKKSAELTQKFSKSIVCSEGLFPFAKNDHIAYWLLNPPRPPFIIVIGDQKRQHLYWRTDVSISQDIFNIRIGESQFLIRREKLISGLQACKRITAIINAENSSKKINSPFLVLSRDLSELAHAKLRSDVLEAALSNDEIKSAISELLTLTHGEVWALNPLIYAKSPHRPQALIFSNQTKLDKEHDHSQ